MQGVGLDSGQLRFSLSFESAQRDEWNQGSRRVSGPPREASSFVLINSVRAGLGWNLEGEVSLPVAWLNAKDENGKESRVGAGDLLTRVSWSSATGPWSYAFSAGAYLPVGELGGDDLPASATFSTGTVDPALGAFVTGPSVLGFGWHMSVSTRQVLAERDDGSRLGSSYTVASGLSRRLSKQLSSELLLTYFSRGRDKGNMMEDTGGDWLYLQPFLSVDLYAAPSYAFQVLLGGRIPLVQNVEGTQLVESPALSFGLAHTLSF